MGKKRKLDGKAPEAQPEAESPAIGGMGGLWGGATANMLQVRLREMQSSQAAAILGGVTAIEIAPSQIDDEIGSDRIAAWREEESFQALIADMKRRGQRQPIRVRPADPDWSPADQAPFAGDGRFILQSGRRRLAAAIELERPVWAVISTDAGDQRVADLEERFLENTMRADLSGFEQLLSIGLIAQSHSDLSQSEIAGRLAVPQGDVSLGLSCVELYDDILATVDVRNTPKRAFRSLIPKLRNPARPEPPRKAGTPKGVAIERRARGLALQVTPAKDGLTLKVQGREFGFLELERLTNALTRLLEEVEDERGEGPGSQL